MWKDSVLLDCPYVHSQLKKKERNQANFNCNDVFYYASNTDNLRGILTLQVRQQAKKARDA